MYVVLCILQYLKYQLWYDLLWFTKTVLIQIHNNYSHYSTCINVCGISICNIILLHLLLLSYLDSFCLKNIYFFFTFCVILGMMQASTWICVSCDKVFFLCHIYLVGIRITCWPYLWVYLWKSISSHLTRTSSSHMVEKLLISARGHWDWGLWWQFRSIGWPFCVLCPWSRHLILYCRLATTSGTSDMQFQLLKIKSFRFCMQLYFTQCVFWGDNASYV